MSKSHKTEVSEFCLEGTFRHLVIKDSYKLKGLILATDEGEVYVKLAKPLRTAFDWRLAVGTKLQVQGTKKHYLKSGEIKLKAEQIRAASPQRETNGVTSGAKTSTSSFASSPELTSNSKPAGKAKKATILVCQKSDCMKRGGKALCKALGSAISDRGLEEQVTIKATGCMKKCKAGPNLVMPDKTRYSRIQAGQVSTLIDKHFDSQEVEEKQLVESVETESIPMAS